MVSGEPYVMIQVIELCFLGYLLYAKNNMFIRPTVISSLVGLLSYGYSCKDGLNRY